MSVVGDFSFTEQEFEGDLLLAAQNGDADRVACLMLVHDGADVLCIGDLLAINGDD